MINSLAVLNQFLYLQEQKLKRATHDLSLRSASSPFQLQQQLQQQRQKHEDEILLVADFLCAGSSCLDGALHVLEQQSSIGSNSYISVSTSHGVINNSNSSSSTGRHLGLSGTTQTTNETTGSCSGVTRFQSPHRSLFVVQGNSTPSAARKFGVNASSSYSPSAYLCMVPEFHDDQDDDVLTETDRKTTTIRGNGTTEGIYYCSCRSFLERNRSSVSSGDWTGSTGTPLTTFSLCKHLLAIKLMPALGMLPTVVELESDELFSRVVAERLWSCSTPQPE